MPLFGRYPAPGCRHSNYGTLYNAGYYGYNWSSVVSDSNARYLYFTNSGITPQNTTFRAAGLQVRCLLE